MEDSFMANTRKSRVPLEEQIRLITECRNSGMVDAEWCRQNDIAPSTFYNWVTRCRRNACSIPESNYFRHSQPKPDVVPVEVISDSAPDRHTLQPVSTEVANKSHTIEVALNNITVRICNDADPGLLSKVLHVIQEVSC